MLIPKHLRPAGRAHEKDGNLGCWIPTLDILGPFGSPLMAFKDEDAFERWKYWNLLIGKQSDNPIIIDEAE